MRKRKKNLKFQKSESAKNVLNGLKKRKQSTMSNGFDSLELLRQNIQYIFDQKIEEVIEDLMEKYFKPAVANIKNNTYETISERQVKFLNQDSSRK